MILIKPADCESNMGGCHCGNRQIFSARISMKHPQFFKLGFAIGHVR
jgi:hypothetical protein